MDDLKLQVNNLIKNFIQEWDVENKKAQEEERYPDFGKFMGCVAELYTLIDKAFIESKIRLGMTPIPKRKGMFGGK